jgi:hypothetical protein
LYTKEPKSTDKKILPIEPENIPEELKVRPHADQAEQLSLLSVEELAMLRRPFGSQPPRRDEIPLTETAKVCRLRRPEGDAVQDKLPGF